MKGFCVPVCAVSTTSPVTTSWPSWSLSEMIAVFAPSEVPALTSTGRTNSPSFSHTVPVRFSTIGWDGDVALFCLLDLEGELLASVSAGFHERASGTTCARDDGIQRRATLG